MTPASELKERAKDSATYLKGLLGKYLGPNSKIGGLLFSIAGNLKSKVLAVIETQNPFFALAVEPRPWHYRLASDGDREGGEMLPLIGVRA